MINKKSFDLNKDEKKTKHTERLYQPKNFRWCKYIVIPLLFGFILLLILTNVDFTGEAYNHTHQNHLQAHGRMSTRDNSLRENLRQIKLSISRALNCIQSTDSCSLTCVGGNINNIYKQLEPLYKSCNRDLDLILMDCSLPSKRLKNDFFQGNYRLKTVNITNCNLAAIQNKAFDQESVKNLQNITLINAEFITLDKSAFEGLQQLQYFELINKLSSGTTFEANGFLAYFAETLTTLVMQQEALVTNMYDPLNWLQGLNMTRLTSVNLANNNFQNILNDQTFSTLVSVQYLQLSNCSLTSLETNVFDSILKTLKHLDLSNNQLTVLPGEMLMQMNGLELNLSFNYWQCTCEDNKDMLQIIKWKLLDIVILDDRNVKCVTPAQWQDMCVNQVDLECLVSTTLAISDTTNGEITQHETDETVTTTVITTTLKSTSDASSSSQTSEETETNETSSESSEITTSETTVRTTIFTTTTTPAVPIAPTTTTATTTRYTSTTTPAPPPLITIFCYNSNNERYSYPVAKTKYLFAIKPISATAIKIVTNNFLSNMTVLYFANATNYTIASEVQRRKHEYFIIINNLNATQSYVFCLVQQLKRFRKLTQTYNLAISPFDCRSYSRPEILPQAWLEREDQAWIISVVVLAACLMLFLGIILIVVIIRCKKRNKKKYARTLNRDLEMETNYLQPNYMEATNNLTKRNCAALLRPSDGLYLAQRQPPDVVVQHVNCNSNYALYEELIM